MWLTSEPTVWMPTQASNHAAMIDNLYYFLYWVSVVAFVVIVLLIGWMLMKYKYKGDKNERAESQEDHGTALEIAWTIPVAVLSVMWFYMGAVGFIDMRTPPADAYEIQVTGMKWSWQFKYPNGAIDTNLHVPTDRPVRLVMNATDVLHSFFVPAFRVKQDLVPGRYTSVWFHAEIPGEYQGFCTEYCGTKHSDMLFKVIAHPSGEFEKWVLEAGNILDKYPIDVAGKMIYERNGCQACHSVDGSKGVAPTFKGAWGVARKLADGSSVTMDENYVRQSILQPQSQIVAGYPPVMPTFQGRIKDEEISAIIAYMKTLK